MKISINIGYSLFQQHTKPLSVFEFGRVSLYVKKEGGFIIRFHIPDDIIIKTKDIKYRKMLRIINKQRELNKEYSEILE